MTFTKNAIERLIDLAWEKNECPLCGAVGKTITDHGDETFEQRRGCLACNSWWEKPRLRDSKIVSRKSELSYSTFETTEKD